MFFQLIARRYEKKSTTITLKSFSDWGEFYSYNTLAKTILVCLIHSFYYY
ncbi:ATP-binding protein [Proteinivorax tanatarense]